MKKITKPFLFLSLVFLFTTFTAPTPPKVVTDSLPTNRFLSPVNPNMLRDTDGDPVLTYCYYRILFPVAGGGLLESIYSPHFIIHHGLDMGHRVKFSHNGKESSIENAVEGAVYSDTFLNIECIGRNNVWRINDIGLLVTADGDRTNITDKIWFQVNESDLGYHFVHDRDLTPLSLKDIGGILHLSKIQQSPLEVAFKKVIPNMLDTDGNHVLTNCSYSVLLTGHKGKLIQGRSSPYFIALSGHRSTAGCSVSFSHNGQESSIDNAMEGAIYLDTALNIRFTRYETVWRLNDQDQDRVTADGDRTNTTHKIWFRVTVSNQRYHFVHDTDLAPLGFKDINGTHYLSKMNNSVGPLKVKFKKDN